MPEANIKLSFMTWVTPNWSVEDVIAAARKYGYNGVEIRVESNHAHGIEKTSTPESLKSTSLRFREAGVEVCAIATGCHFAIKEAAEREKQVNDLLAYIDLANVLGCSRVRVFGGEIPPGVEPAGAIDWVADAIASVLDVAEQKRVSVLLETHDSFSHTKYVREVMRQVYSNYAGVVWDPAHPCRHLETIEEAFENIAPHVKHCHVHDMVYNAERTATEFAKPGTGIVPHADVVRLLARNAYNGYLSVEVMKGDPDEILASYAEVYRSYIKAAVGQ
jgi:sugar phosphate isomerase/epimerase